MAKITIDKEKCIGCGSCSAVCEEIFGIKNNKAYVKKQSNVKCVKEAIDVCPVNVIKLK